VPHNKAARYHNMVDRGTKSASRHAVGLLAYIVIYHVKLLFDDKFVTAFGAHASRVSTLCAQMN